ncbi:hypothetical protein J2X46_002395 [Nocardioides sp. BE266]|uniref:fibronectin type III domain-containing protein n=1 Tax=Nocardioides sp. BE266 TaxID=2817725 RepID=UPI00285678E5|nr:fibronectin type III domain-containing protein [Nocardioides sp. BE266]MDR7253410.1 hypothetical protein [Nocardioides sp. BE266]
MSLPLPRRRLRSCAALLALGVVASTTSVSLAYAEPAPAGTTRLAEPHLLDEPARGAAAIRELGDDLQVAAVRNDLGTSELRDLLRTDRTAWLDVDGRVHFVDPAAGADPATEVAPAAVAPLADTFSLHSNPGSSLKIFLDVDGADVSGTAWNASDGVTAGTHPAWDPAGDGASFSDSERAAVQEVWALVAEDYAPFGVDVTTQDPGTAGLVRSSSSDTAYGTRVLISPSNDAWSKICGSGCGGVAYLSVFDEIDSPYQPAWVFPQALYDEPKAVAEAASHEAGHNLGLAHDATASSSYYSGHGNWAPIMGVGYNRPIVQWSRGSYPGANNTQDDVAIVAGYLGRRTDEDGTSGEPVALPVGPAVISAASDVDTYRLGTCPANTVVEVDPVAYAPNLDVQLTVRDGTGSVVSTVAPASGFGDGATATGLGASVTLAATGPGWTISVDGVGEGTWAGGYDDYGSLGAYTVSAPGCTGETDEDVPTAPRTPSAGSATTSSLTLGWTAPANAGISPVTGYVVARYGSTQTWTLPADARSHVFTGLAAGTAYVLSVRAVNAAGEGPAATTSASTLAPPVVPTAPGVPAQVVVRSGDASAVVTWAAPAANGSPITAYTVTARSYGMPTRTVGVTAPATSATLTGLTNAIPWLITVSATNAVGTSAESAALTAVPMAPPTPTPPANTTPVLTPTTAPARMKAPRLSARRRTMTVVWTAASSPDSLVTKYRIDLSKGRDRTTTGGITRLVIRRLKPGTYRVRVSALNAVGWSPYSGWARIRVR